MKIASDNSRYFATLRMVKLTRDEHRHLHDIAYGNLTRKIVARHISESLVRKRYIKHGLGGSVITHDGLLALIRMGRTK